MTERRYSETEIALIFERASEAQQGVRTPLGSRDGMTLGTLQEIGREVGLPPDLVARAAREIDRLGTAGTSRFLGLPMGVQRTVELDRRLTSDEWEALVVDLRQTFDARGSLRQDGNFRQWTNGNLQALLEPSGSSHRLRLRTLNGAARAWMTGGIAVLGFAVATLLGATLGEVRPDAIWARLGVMVMAGVAMFAAGALRLPVWASKRRLQMQEIGARLIERVEGGGR